MKKVFPISNREIATASGVSMSTVQRYFKGKGKTTRTNRLAIARSLGVSLKKLSALRDEMLDAQANSELNKKSFDAMFTSSNIALDKVMSTYKRKE